jgi:hypothetical protein
MGQPPRRKKFNENLIPDHNKGRKKYFWEVQSCGYYVNHDEIRYCIFFVDGLCFCLLSKNCPFGNKFRIWINEAKASDHSKKCQKIFTKG